MNRDVIIQHIIERLGTAEITYRNNAGREKTVFEAGVLIPLFFRASQSTDEELVFLLSKRSDAVSQSGDLSGPGGKLEPVVDRFLRFFIARGFPPLIKGNALRYALQRGKGSFDTITLFLANAVRESWEEIRLSPFNLRFLGPLPPSNLVMFTKTIYPLVGLIEKRWTSRLNREVDKLVEIPLDAFYHEKNYGVLSIPSQCGGEEGGRYYPCLVHREETGEEEILWGATLRIITSFLNIVFDFTPPEIRQENIILKTLHPDYLTGNRKRYQTP
ncbi:MAG: CoA pyrophosphatase [Deltaproteobacteria bacterium]|nr:CoA pyrophosphatase [Deltaproteobacteria bacterium]